MITPGHARPAVVIRLGDPRAKTVRIRFATPAIAAALLPPRVDTPSTIPIRTVTRQFCMYVMPADRHHPPGYLSPNDDLGSVAVGPVVRSHRRGAIQFNSVADVDAMIRRYGWLVSTSVKPGWTTAYAAEWLP